MERSIAQKGGDAVSGDSEWLMWLTNAIEDRIKEIEAKGKRTKKGKLRAHEERKILVLRAQLARYKRAYASSNGKL